MDLKPKRRRAQRFAGYDLIRLSLHVGKELANPDTAIAAAVRDGAAVNPSVLQQMSDELGITTPLNRRVMEDLAKSHGFILARKPRHRRMAKGRG